MAHEDPQLKRGRGGATTRLSPSTDLTSTAPRDAERATDDEALLDGLRQLTPRPARLRGLPRRSPPRGVVTRARQLFKTHGPLVIAIVALVLFGLGRVVGE